jgi:hypothetical protein
LIDYLENNLLSIIKSQKAFFLDFRQAFEFSLRIEQRPFHQEDDGRKLRPSTSWVEQQSNLHEQLVGLLLSAFPK